MKRTHRSKELTELQELRLENKKLKEQIRSLKKEIKYLQKQEHFHENVILEEQAEQLVLFEDKPTKKLCPLCFKGELVEYNVVGRHWLECSQCEYDSRKK